jgi:L-ascorbate metabolism protein UlaG (beta-lactamase superfamily)
MRLRRANLDASWVLTLGGARLLVDPWLVGSEVDGFGWFSEQWHTGPCLAPEDLRDIDAVVLTQPFDDHCHLPTLARLPPVPILAVQAAAARLRRAGFPAERLTAIAAETRWEGLTLRHLPPPALAPTHGAVRVEGPDGRALIAAHGLRPDAPADPVDVLLVTHATYALPWWLGGTVNLGADAAKALAERVGARIVVDTHAEQKRARGLVAAVARPAYPAAAELPGVRVWVDLEERDLS